MIKLLSSQVTDSVVRENFSSLESEINSLPIRKGDWIHLEITVNSAVTNFKFPHSLGFMPKDVIPTANPSGVTITWNSDKFSRTEVDITTSGAGTFRAFVGSYLKR